MKITTNRPAHLTTAEVETEMAAIYGENPARTTISDAAALTIASWYQAPDGDHGETLAELASTGKVDYFDLLYAVGRELETETNYSNRQMLHALYLWAMREAAVV